MPIRRQKRHMHASQYAGGGKSHGFSPASIASQKLWLAATNLTLADGDFVELWSDLSGTGNHFTQAGGSDARPVYKVNRLNAQPSVLFDAANDFLSCSTWGALSQPNTIFVVFRATAVGGGNRIIDGNGAQRTFFGYDGLTQYQLNSGSNLVGGTPNTSAHVLVAVVNGASSSVYADGGTAVLTGNPGAGGMGATVSLGEPTGALSPIGDIFEVLVYNAAVSSANINLIGKYLATKYALTWTAVS